MGSSGRKEEREEMMGTEIILTEKKNTKNEERETAMAVLGLVLLVAGAKHAFASLVQQWRPLLVFFLLNLVLLAILFTSIHSNKSSNKEQYNNKKMKKIKMVKKKRSMSTTSRSNSCCSSSSVHQELEDYFCKTSEHKEEMITSNSLAANQEEPKDIYEVGVEDRTPTVPNDHNVSNNNNNNNSKQHQEDINARVEAFIVMFRQQLALDALQASSKGRSDSTYISRRRSTDDRTQVAFDYRHNKGALVN